MSIGYEENPKEAGEEGGSPVPSSRPPVGLGERPDPDESPRRRRPPSRGFGPLDALFWLPRQVFKLFFPRLLDRYILSELVPPLLFGWTMFIVLWVLSINMFKLAQLVGRGARLAAVAEMLGLRVVLSSSYCLPMAVLLAGLMAFGRLSGDSELVAMQAAGIRNLRCVWNAFIMGLALSFLGLALNEYVIPPAGKRLHYVEDVVKAELAGKMADEMTDNRAFIIQDMEKKQLSRLVAARKYEPPETGRPATMRDVTYVQYDNSGVRPQVQMIIEASRAEYLGPDKSAPGTRKWNFFDATTQVMSAYTQGQKWTFPSKVLDLTLNKSPEAIQKDQKDADEMTYRELKAYIDTLRRQKVHGRPVRELRVQLERKLSIPFAALVLALIGAPLGIRKQRTTAGVGIGLSLLIIIIYYVGIGTLEVMGTNGQVTAFTAAWGCNLVGLLVGLYLTLRSS